MWSLLSKPAFHLALQLSHKQLTDFFGKKIDETVVEAAQAKVTAKIDSFIAKIEKRTQLYFMSTLLHLALLVVVFLVQSFWFSALSALYSLGALLFYVRSSILAFLEALHFFENFEGVLRKSIEDGFVHAKETGWQGRLALFFDSRDSKHYYRLVLEQVVRALSLWIGENRRVIYVRMALYGAAWSCLSISLRELLVF